MDQQPQDALEKIRANLLLMQPFFGLMLSTTECIEDNKACDTMATNGKVIYYNTEFSKKLKTSELLGVFLHEVLHVVLMHCDRTRAGTRDWEIWCIAADYAVNSVIHDMGTQYVLPGKHLYDSKYHNSTVEEIYNDLYKEFQKQHGMTIEEWRKELGDMLMDKLLPANGKDMDGIKERILMAADAVKNRGTLPDGIEQLLKELRKSKVRWERVFHRFVGQAISRDDYSYGRPNKKYLHEDLYLPDLMKHIIGKIVLAIDLSGSVVSAPTMLEQFVAEFKKLAGMVDEITYMGCDADVHEVVKISQFDDILKKVKFRGGGGTSFVPVFEKVQEMHMQPELLIYLTDTDGEFPKKAPPYPVLWCTMSKDAKVPWGMLVEITE